MAAVAPDLDDPERLREELRSFLGLGHLAPAARVEVLSSSNEDGFLLQRVDVVTEDDTKPLAPRSATR